jgi:dienelactone hydrolase
MPLPAALLLSDAGIQDRDGDPSGPGDPNLSLLKRLAIRLGEGGIASLRCDDRGAGRPRAASPALPVLTADARAMLAALRKEPAVDAARTGVVGQGEGGLVAALIADGDAKIKAVGLLATAARPLDTVVQEQTEATLRRFGYPEPEIVAAVAEQRATYEAIRRGAPLPTTLSAAERTAIRDGRPWLRSHLALDPAVVVGRLANVPVLLAQGGKDARVSVADFERLRDALVGKAGNRGVTAKLYPELNHPFAPAINGSLTDYLDPRAEVSTVVLDDVRGFLAGALLKEHQVAAASPR